MDIMNTILLDLGLNESNKLNKVFVRSIGTN